MSSANSGFISSLDGGYPIIAAVALSTSYFSYLRHGMNPYLAKQRQMRNSCAFSPQFVSLLPHLGTQNTELRLTA